MADFLRFNIQGVADAADELPFRIGKLIVGVSERQHIFNQFKSQPAAADFGGIADAQFCGVFEKLRQNFSLHFGGKAFNKANFAVFDFTVGIGKRA